MMKSKREKDTFAIERTLIKKELVRNTNDYDCSKSEGRERIICSEDEDEINVSLPPIIDYLIS